MDIDDLGRICHQNKSVTEDIKWGHDLCYLVGEKMFCVAAIDPPLTVAFKVLPEEFEELLLKPGIIPAPYMARNMWVKVMNLGVFTKREWEYYISQSYELVKSKIPKKTREKLGL